MEQSGSVKRRSRDEWDGKVKTRKGSNGGKRKIRQQEKKIREREERKELHQGRFGEREKRVKEGDDIKKGKMKGNMKGKKGKKLNNECFFSIGDKMKEGELWDRERRGRNTGKNARKGQENRGMTNMKDGRQERSLIRSGLRQGTGGG